MSTSPKTLTQEDLTMAKALVEHERCVPADLVSRLLADREVWVTRACEDAEFTARARRDFDALLTHIEKLENRGAGGVSS